MCAKTRRRILFFTFLLLPFFLWLIPVEWLNEQHSLCLFRNIFGIKCFGCGITRAVLSVLHFDFKTAFDYNKLIVIVFPLLLFVWIRLLRICFKSGCSTK
ncbi:MAG: DUF2752 domain-containing protein [Bacteroidales bacterium]|jgi:hypothetical protein|nr:DUF2752 domain-containing protein [Bacteroidales bacterium]